MALPKRTGILAGKILVITALLYSFTLVAGCCPPFCPPQPGPEGKARLSPPTVDAPLYECATAVSVGGFVPGAKIDIYSNGTTTIGGGVSDAPWGQSFSVNPPLIDGQVITATQTAGGAVSPPSKAVTVQAFFKTHPEGLPKPRLDTPVYNCGGAIGVSNLAPGGLLEVFSDGALAGKAPGCGAGQWLFVKPPFATGQKVYAAETLCTTTGPKSDAVAVVPEPASLPAPVMGAVYEGGKYCTVSSITNGATVTVYDGPQPVASHACSGGSQAFRLNPQPAAGDSLRAVQSLCSSISNTSPPIIVKPCNELPAPKVSPVCIGDDSVTVTGTAPDARIRVYANGTLIGDGGGTKINLFQPAQAGDSITVTQSLGNCTSPASAPFAVGKVACSIPGYDPGYWNDGYGPNTIQDHNNCYNYSNNKRTDTFAQPGRAAGISMSWDDMHCDRVFNAAKADGILPLPPSGICPCNKDKIALVVAPDEDYHWYRLDSGGKWSHKPGHTEATNLDNSHHTISSPETADRGGYTDFCGYFCSCSDERQGQGHENIQ